MTQPYGPDQRPSMTWVCFVCGERGTGPTPTKHFEHTDDDKTQRRREHDWLAEQMVKGS